MKHRDSFSHLLRHGSVETLEIERMACLASSASGIRERVPLIDARLTELRSGSSARSRR